VLPTSPCGRADTVNKALTTGTHGASRFVITAIGLVTMLSLWPFMDAPAQQFAAHPCKLRACCSPPRPTLAHFYRLHKPIVDFRAPPRWSRDAHFSFAV